MSGQMHIGPDGEVTCAECRDQAAPTVPLERTDVSDPENWTCDGCGRNVFTGEEVPDAE